MHLKTTKPLAILIGTKKTVILPHHPLTVPDHIGKRLLARSPHVRRVKGPKR